MIKNHSGDVVEVSARIASVVKKPDLEVVLAFPVEGSCGSVEMLATCQV